MAGIFTISLDYELHWGVFDKRTLRERTNVYRNTLALVPRMLELFEKYDVRVTWATVGSMFASGFGEWRQIKPAFEPKYQNMAYSAYQWVEKTPEAAEYEWELFAPDSIKLIRDTRGQEVATHTFSHYYCLEEQYAPEAFEHDLKSVVKAAELLGCEAVSLVFPRNQFNPALLKTCYRYGIQVIRSNPANWYWKPVNDKGSGLMRKMIRTADAYIQLGKERSSYPLSDIKAGVDEPLQVPASRFFRPWRSKYKFANALRLNHVCAELKNAAIHDECYHLWFHPENFGDHPEQNIKSLEQVLRQFRKCQERYGMTSWNMSDYAKNLLNGSRNQSKARFTSKELF